MKLSRARSTATPVDLELAGPMPGGLTAGAARAERIDVHGLYMESGGQVRSALRRLTDGRDVEDLVQEVFVVALARRNQLQAATSPRAWLLGVAVKVAAGHRRRAWVRGWLGLDEVKEPAATSSPHRDAERRDAERLVRQGLEALSPRKREVFVLFELEGLSGQEIAVAVGCPLKTIWTRLFHARKDFAQQLEAMGARHE